MRFLKRLAWSLISFLIALALAEVLVGRLFPVGTPIFRLDDELLFAHIPGQRTVQLMNAEAGGARIPIEIDDAGRRGPMSTGPENAWRIGAFGDSLAFGGNVAQDETFPERLAHHLRAAGQPAVALNAGVTAYGPDQTLLKLERELVQLDLSAVVLVLCAHNDFGDLMRNKLFRLNGTQLERCRPTVAAHLVDDFAERAERAQWFALRRAFAFLADRSAAPATQAPDPSAAPLLIQQYLVAGEREYEDFLVFGNLEVVSFFQDYYDADVAIEPERPPAQATLALLGAVLAQIARVCEQAGVPLLALVVPSAVDLDPGFRIRVDPERWPSYDPARLAGELTRLCAAARIEALDLTSSFQADPAAMFVGADDFHWTAAGQDRAAEAASEALQGLVGD